MKRIVMGVLLVVWGSGCLATDQVATSEVQRTGRIRELLSMLANDKIFDENPNLAADSITELGKLKAVEAIPLLIKHLHFCDRRQEFSPWRFGSVVDCRVAVDALVRIEEPSIKPVLEASRGETNRLRQVCMASVLSRVKGWQQAAKLVDFAIADSKDAQEKEHLQKLKSFILKPPID